MVMITVRGMGQEWSMTTPDQALIGPWLMALFDSFKYPTRWSTFEISVQRSG